MKNLSPIPAVIAAVVHLLTLAGLVHLAVQERRTRAQADSLRRHLDDLEARVDETAARLLARDIVRGHLPGRAQLASVARLCPKSAQQTSGTPRDAR